MGERVIPQSAGSGEGAVHGLACRRAERPARRNRRRDAKTRSSGQLVDVAQKYIKMSYRWIARFIKMRKI
ncbi:MAG: hypothetical protein DME24_07155 [Verrucomicrobia bacterium]|nr:MAG: hypothetical protein DME24_07155 [Verrucomicrobiota bacterium]